MTSQQVSLENPVKLGAEAETDPSDGVLTQEQERASLHVETNEKLNAAMKEEQQEFAYENMENGSNKSFANEEEIKQTEGLLGNINMDQLIQNPGRGSHNSGSKEERKSVTTNNNIFAAKVRKAAPSGDKN